MFEIIPIPALKDNYIWMIVRSLEKTALVVDPGEAQPVLDVLNERDLTLSGILITHHHWDHTNGIDELLKHFSVPVYAGAKDPVPACTHPLSQDDRVHFPELDCEFKIYDIPGHTKGHIAFVGIGGIFTGDTLFSVGCGKIFEGTPEQMFDSLNKLKRLREDLFVYCGHEYTQNNLRFAKLIEPNNPEVLAHIEATNSLREKNLPTLPSTLKLEKAINPFLRCDQASVRKAAEKHAEKPLSTALEVFTELREWKNSL